jgi:signal peptidase I
VRENAKIEGKKVPKARGFLLALLTGLLSIAMLVVLSTLRAFEIPSSSMEDTLLIGDHMFVNCAQSGWATRWMAPLLPHGKIRRGDVEVFLSPEGNGLFVVRRVIGIPGDRLHLRDGMLFRNGVQQDEPYVRHKFVDSNPYRDNFPAVPPSEMFGVRNQDWALSLPRYIEGEDLVVPPDSYFGMGDNREVSYDSRYYGFFPRENVIGRPMFIYWSFITPPNQYQMRSMGDRLGFLAHIIIHFFDETRWSRTFKVVQ